MIRAHDQSIGKADQVEEKAAEWVARVDMNGSPAQYRALDAWLDENPRHRAAFLRISVAWNRADALRNLAPAGETADPDLLAPERPPMAESITEPPRAQRPRRPARYALAAALALVLIGAGAFFARDYTLGQTYATALGEFRRVALPDGSTVSLNTDSAVRIRYTSSGRKIALLHGEAHFDVAHDTQRPFDVAAGDTMVRAVGTSFSVRLRNEEAVDVLVSEGRVAINPPSDATVGAGELAFVRKGVVTSGMQSADDITRRLAWMEGQLRFDGQTLSEVIAEFNRYNRRRMVISDPAMARIKIGGAFRATNPEVFTASLQRSFHVGVRVHETARGTEIWLDRGDR